MVIRIPRPSDLLEAAQTVAGLPTDAIRLVSKIGALLDDAEALLVRTRRLLDEVERAVASVDDATRRAEAVIASAEATTTGVQRLVEEYVPLAERAAPLAHRFVAELSEQEVHAAIKLLDQLPALTEHMEQDVMPILATLDRVGPDVHELLKVTRDLREAIVGVPGFAFFRRRGEDREDDDLDERGDQADKD
jgi:ABC-type transporter Mla subunit MlaD